MKEKLTNNLVLKIASVLFAVVVWLIVLNINDPSKTVSVSDIPVEIINDDAITDLGKTYSIKSGSNCTIKITGPRSIVDQLDTEDFKAVADIKDLSLTNSVPIEVELRKSTYKSKVDILVETTLKLEIEDIIEKEYEVKVEYIGEIAESYVVTGTQLENGTVKIKAPRSQMDKIKNVVTYVDLTGRDDDFSSTTDIKLLDIYGKEIGLQEKEIELTNKTVNSTSTVLYKKEVSIVCELPDAIDYNTLISGHTLSVDKITVVGRKAVLDGLERIELQIDLDEYRDAEDNIELKFAVNSLLAEGIYNYTSVEEIVLKININQQYDRVITTKAKNISISNIPDGLEASLVTKGDISFTVRGPKDLVDDLSLEDIILKVDVDELDEGTHKLEVTITLPEGIRVLDTIEVEVSLANKEETSGDETTDNDQETETSSETETTEPGSSEEPTSDIEETTTPIEDEE